MRARGQALKELVAEKFLEHGLFVNLFGLGIVLEVGDVILRV